MHIHAGSDIVALEPQKAPAFRELTSAETGHVAGGIVPIIVAAAVIAVAALEQSGDDSPDGGEEDSQD